MQWYACIVGINQESLAYQGLKSKGFDAYYPTGKRITRHARQEKIRIFPVFSRYIFVKFDIEKEWSEPIRSTDGVLDIISNNWIPMTIPEWCIEDIKQRELAGEFNQLPAARKKQPRWHKSFQVLKNLLNPEAVIHV